MTSRWVRRAAALLLCLAAACAARHAPAPESTPYVVTTDVTHWIRDLETGDLFQTQPAVTGLAALGPAVIPVLERAFEREPAQVRVGVVEVLSDLDVPETLPLLLRAAKDPEPEVRADAVDALGGLRDERGCEAVEAALGDSNMSVVAAATRACLPLCRSRGAMETLVHRTLAGLVVANQSLVAILRGRDSEQLVAAREAVNLLAPQVIESEANPELRVRAALLLVEVSPERALPLLRDYTASGSQTLLRMQAITALGATGSELDARMLKDLHRSTPPPYIKQATCGALRRMAARGVLRIDDVPKDCPLASRETK